VIVVETPAADAADIAGKDEASTAAAITPTASVSATDEAATAAAIAPDQGGSSGEASGGISLVNP